MGVRHCRVSHIVPAQCRMAIVIRRIVAPEPIISLQPDAIKPTYSLTWIVNESWGQAYLLYSFPVTDRISPIKCDCLQIQNGRRLGQHTVPRAGSSSGSHAQLPAHGPLRTVRGSFDPYGSSLAKASRDTRLHHVAFGMRTISTAIEMVHLKIAGRIRTAVRFPHNMTNAPRSIRCDWSLALRARTVLP